MTIRRRLFWSNILMILIPVLLCAFISYLILFFFTKGSAVPLEQAFPQAMEAIATFQRRGDMGNLQEQVDLFNETFANDNIFMVVMEGNALAYPANAEELIQGNAPLLHALIADGAVGSVSINKMRFVIEEAGDYRILLVNRHATQDWDRYRPPMHGIRYLFLLVLVAILIANRVVTHLLTRRITRPLRLLAQGANQLGEGNLDHRIIYGENDEFAPVCQAFNEMAVQLQKLINLQQKNDASRKELLAGISHDLRTPLTSIRAYVEGLLDGVAENLPSQLKYLSIIRNKAEDIDHIVDKLFLFSKLDIGDYPVNLEKVDLGEELRAMQKAVEEEYEEKGLSMLLEDQVGEVYIHMDPVYLHNIFVNILENSLRYKTAEHCTVRVGCRVEELSVTVSMADNGPGVREDELEKIFDVFYRGDPSRQNPSKGSGLGLAISAQMMSRIGGSIRGELPEEGGLRILLQFPRYAHNS